MHRTMLWLIGGLTYFFAFAGGVFWADGEGASPVWMFIMGNMLGAAMVALVLFWDHLAKPAGGVRRSGS
jgi:uncharacterized membrane protein YhhN